MLRKYLSIAALGVSVIAGAVVIYVHLGLDESGLDYENLPPTAAGTTIDTCGQPTVNQTSSSALRLWKNCSTGAWTMQAYAGKGTSKTTYQGSISSSLDAKYVATNDFEKWDTFDSSNLKDIAFALNVSNGGKDEVTFTFPQSADVCLSVDAPDKDVLIGPNSARVESPLNLSTLGPCRDSSCGDLSYSSAEENTAFVWRDCDADRWHLRITGGGSKTYDHYKGKILSSQKISSVTGVSVESNDIINTQQSTEVVYDLTVGGIYQDGLDFTLASGSSTCVDTGTEFATVGIERRVVKSPFNIATMEPCATYGISEPAAAPTPAAPAAPVVSVAYQTVKPGILNPNILLPNPGKGFEQAGTILNNGRFNYNSTVDYDTDITYIRLPWANLEADGDQKWNWEDLDAAINDTVARGKQAAISVLSWKPILDDFNYQQAIPAWYMNDPRHVRCTDVDQPAGCTYYKVNSGVNCSGSSTATCSNLWTFNHDDPIFIQEQVELIDALRKRYDNPTWAEKIAYMDIRSIGSWSESHTTNIFLVGKNTRWPMPKWSNFKRIIDAHLAFKYIPQIANFDNDDKYREQDGTHPWDYACRMAQEGGQTIGWRSDGIEVTGWEINKVWEWSEAARECWKTGPVYAEPMDGMGMQTSDLKEGLQQLSDWHASGWNNKYSKSFPNDPSYVSVVEQWLAKAGYRLYVPEAKIPSTAAANQDFQVEVDLANAGLAPFYRNFYALKVRFSPKSGGNDVVVDLPGELRNVLPDEPAVRFSGVGKLSSGTYAVSVGIIQDPTFGSKFPVKLAQESSTCRTVGADWWCDIGSTSVK